MTWPAVLVAALIAAGIALLWLRRRHLVVTVRGASMSPTYDHGDVVLVRRARGHKLKAGQIAVVDLPESLRPIPPGVSKAESLLNRRVIKRVAATAGDATPVPIKGFQRQVPAGHLVLLGDNPDASGDSRLYGFVPTDAVVGTVIRRLKVPR